MTCSSHLFGRIGPALATRNCCHFAAITDEPPPEITAAGHDRCIIPIKPENIDAWLNPDASNLAAQYAILDDRDRPYYEHRMAA
ncbi:putative SOS response-associated peptidase YedK [Paraburkholderia sp. WC7.3d]